jgi:hypothetical protein
MGGGVASREEIARGHHGDRKPVHASQDLRALEVDRKELRPPAGLRLRHKVSIIAVGVGGPEIERKALAYDFGIREAPTVGENRNTGSPRDCSTREEQRAVTRMPAKRERGDGEADSIGKQVSQCFGDHHSGIGALQIVPKVISPEGLLWPGAVKDAIRRDDGLWFVDQLDPVHGG